MKIVYVNSFALDKYSFLFVIKAYALLNIKFYEFHYRFRNMLQKEFSIRHVSVIVITNLEWSGDQLIYHDFQNCKTHSTSTVWQSDHRVENTSGTRPSYRHNTLP